MAKQMGEAVAPLRFIGSLVKLSADDATLMDRFWDEEEYVPHCCLTVVKELALILFKGNFAENTLQLFVNHFSILLSRTWPNQEVAISAAPRANYARASALYGVLPGLPPPGGHASGGRTEVVSKGLLIKYLRDLQYDDEEGFSHIWQMLADWIK